MFDSLEHERMFYGTINIVLSKFYYPNIVKLEGLVTSDVSYSSYLVFDYMEHDLAAIATCPKIMFIELPTSLDSS